MSESLGTMFGFQELEYDGPNEAWAPRHIAIDAVNPQVTPRSTMVTIRFGLDDYHAEFLFSRSITGSLEHQMPFVSRRLLSQPAFDLDEKAWSIIFRWAEQIVPKAKPAGRDRDTGEIHGYDSPGRWEPHSTGSISVVFESGIFEWARAEK